MLCSSSMYVGICEIQWICEEGNRSLYNLWNLSVGKFLYSGKKGINK